MPNQRQNVSNEGSKVAMKKSIKDSNPKETGEEAKDILPTFKSIEEVHQYYKKIISCMPNNVYWLNRNCITLGCNNNVLKLFGLKKLEDFVGITYEKMGELGGWTEGQALSMKEDDLEVMSTGIAKFNVEEPPLYDEKGNPVYYISSRVPLFDDEGNVIGVVGISVDITKQKEDEKKLAEQVIKTEKAYRSKGEFLSTASHEIRNPLSNTINLIRDEAKEYITELKNIFFDQVINALNETNRYEYVEPIKKLFLKTVDSCERAIGAAQYALDSLQNLDDLHRLSLRGVKPAWEKIQIIDLIENAKAKSTHQNNGKVELVHKIDASVPKMVVIDYENINKALRVFIGNAIRFSHHNEKVKERVKINVEAINENRQSYLRIHIQDFGIGMSENQINRLFTPLFSEDSTEHKILYSKPSVQLLQAKMRIEASGGKLEITSEIDKGTSVLVKVPYQLPDSDTIKENNLSEKNALEANSLTQHLLLVEDDLGIQKTTASQLSEFGYKVDVASSGTKALELASKNRYDLIIMDLTLPDFSGIETTRKINDIYNNNALVIGFTSYASEEDADNCYNAGMSLVLTKPVSKNKLKETIKNVLDASDNKDE